MADTYQNVNAGDDLVIPAPTWNGILDAAENFARRKMGAEGGAQNNDPLTPAVRVLVRNDTGAAIPVGSVLTLGTPIVSAADYPREVSRSPLFPGTAPGAATDQFAITLDPLDIDEIGRAIVMGVVPIDITVTDAAHNYAEPTPTVTATMASAAAGPARIIWKASGTGTKRAVVLLTQGKSGITTVQEEGTALAQRPTINFIGADVTAADDAANNRTNVTISTAAPYAPVGRSVIPDAINENFASNSGWLDTPVIMGLPRSGTYLINVNLAYVTTIGAGYDSLEWMFRVYDTTNARPCETLSAGPTKVSASTGGIGDVTSTPYPVIVPRHFHVMYYTTTPAVLMLQIRGFDRSTYGGVQICTVAYHYPGLGSAPECVDLEYTFMTYARLGQTPPVLSPITWTAGSNTATVPDGASLARTWAWGGGGGGAGSTADKAGGGGGGAFSRGDWRAVSAGDALIGTVGSGGAAGVMGAGGVGGDTNANSGLVIAKGGTGGSTSAAGTGGTAAASTGVTKYNGGNAGALTGTPDHGTGGGGSGGSGGAGGAGASGTGSTGGAGGAAGATDGGAGGAGSASGFPTVGAGGSPGAGGGGSSRGSGTGGAGANGKIYIEFA